MFFQKFGDKDLKFILTKLFPKAMEQISLQDEVLHLPKNVDTAGTDLTPSQKETVSYMVGAILRKLYYKAKSEEER